MPEAAATAPAALNPRQRRLLFVTLAAAALVVVAASVAFACVPWRGDMTVTPSTPPPLGDTLTDGGRQAVTVTGKGAGEDSGGMAWCPSKPSSKAAVIGRFDHVRINLAPSTCVEGDGVARDTRLDDGAYTVSVTDGAFLDASGTGDYSGYKSDCMNITTILNSDGFDVGTPTYQWEEPITVTNGTGEGIYGSPEPGGPFPLLSSDAAPQEAGGICVTGVPSSGVRQGNMVPITTL